jgi:hypothetical protein
MPFIVFFITAPSFFGAARGACPDTLGHRARNLRKPRQCRQVTESKDLEELPGRAIQQGATDDFLAADDLHQFSCE